MCSLFTTRGDNPKHDRGSCPADAGQGRACVRRSRDDLSSMVSMASSLVEHLQDMGVHPQGGPIAVQHPISDRLSVIYLGLYAARYKVHVVDDQPASRAYKLSALPSQALLCESGTAPEPSLRCIFVDKMELDSSRPASSLQVEGDLEDVVFVEYTSGSTGRPKSVAQENWRIAHWARWRQFLFPLMPDDHRVAQNLFFPWYWHIFLCQGGTSVLYPSRLNHDISGLNKYLEQHEVHRFDCLTPGLISALLDVEEKLPPSLKVMISGG